MFISTTQYEILTPYGWQDFDGINESKKQVLMLVLTDGRKITCSLNHVFVCFGKEIIASSIKPKQKLNNRIAVVSIILKSDEFVYDPVNVANGNLYLSHDIISHNCTFNGSSRSLLKADTQSSLSANVPIKEYGDDYKGLRIYEYPKKGHLYSMTVDVSRGRHLDYSAFSIIDVTSYPHTISATFRNNELSPLMYAHVIDKMGRTYNNAYILVEINDIGGQVADTLYSDLEYEGDMFWTRGGSELGKTGSDDYPGIRTTKKTKNIGCAMLKDMIENRQLIVTDFHTISELSTFIQKDNGSFMADEGYHDDMVMTLVLHGWLCSQPFFTDLTNSSLRLKLHEEHARQMEEALVMPFFSDGLEEDQATYNF